MAFCATLPVIGRRGHCRITRLVTLPDYQGIGIGMAVAEAVGDLHRGEGNRVQRHRQPSRADRPLPPLAALANERSEEVWLEPRTASFAATVAPPAGPSFRSSFCHVIQRNIEHFELARHWKGINASHIA